MAITILIFKFLTMKFVQTTDTQRRNIRYVGVCLIMLAILVLMMCLSGCRDVIQHRDTTKQQEFNDEVISRFREQTKYDSTQDALILALLEMQKRYPWDSIRVTSEGKHYTIPARLNEKNHTK